MRTIAAEVKEVSRLISAQVAKDVKGMSEQQILDYLLEAVISHTMKSTLAAGELLEKGETVAAAISATQTAVLRATVHPIIDRLLEFD